MMEPIDAWYRKEVYKWRTGAAIGWTLLCQPVIVAVYLFLCKLNMFHPITWVTEWLSLMFSLHYITMMILLVMVTCALCLVTSSSYTVIPEIAQTRLHAFGQIFAPGHIIQGLMYMSSGAVTVWICSNFIGGRYSYLSVRIEQSDVYILNEYHLFLVMYGMFVGAMYHTCMSVHQNNYVQFPVLQEAKFFQMRSRLYKELLRSLSYSVTWTLYFYPIYWLFGHVPTDFVLSHSFLKRDDYSLNSIWGMLDVRLFYQTLMCGMQLHFGWTVGNILYKIYNSEHFLFPIESAFEEQTNHCLVDALTCKSSALVQFLGFYDMCHLSKNSLERRSQVFSLSQPGGHPHNWNKLCAACVKEIDALNKQVEEANWKVFVSAPVRKPTGEKTMPSADGDKVPTTLTFRGSSVGSDASNGQIEEKPKTNLQTFKDLTLIYLKKKPILSYFMAELPDFKSRKLFASSQLQVWAVEALSNFATTSYSEDKFGIVQRSLPGIITSILNLQENVEKHFKLSTTVSRKGQKEAGTYDVQLGYLLRTTLKSSVYKIINTFDKHVLSLPLSADCVRKLKLFMEYKE